METLTLNSSVLTTKNWPKYTETFSIIQSMYWMLVIQKKYNHKGISKIIMQIHDNNLLISDLRYFFLYKY